MNIITKENIQNNESFILKWANDVALQDGVYNPSWKNPSEADSFLVNIENQTSIINECRMIIMDSMQYDISYLRVRARLQYMGKRSGANKGKQLTTDYTTDITETVPEFSKNSLFAVPFSCFTYTPKTFLLQNIEKANFLPLMEQLLAERAGYSAEQIGMYGVKEASPTTQDGMEYLDGIFKQASDVRTAYETAVTGGTASPQDPQGYYNDINTNAPLIPQLKKMLTQFSIQKGNRSQAKFYVSNLIYGLIVEEADARQTQVGDTLFFNGGELRIWNTKVQVADFLDDPQGDWGEQILLADPDSIVFGFLDQITSENSYEHDMKSYLSSVDVFFDVLILWNKDVLCAKVVSTPLESTPSDSNGG